MTYGDGLGNINMASLVAGHVLNRSLVTLTAVRPIPRFGSMNIDLVTNRVLEFSEKMLGYSEWINGGFFVIEPKALEYINGDDTNWEKEVLPLLVQDEQLHAHTHLGFWQCVDTLRDLETLREEYNKGGAIWLR